MGASLPLACLTGGRHPPDEPACVVAPGCIASQYNEEVYVLLGRLTHTSHGLIHVRVPALDGREAQDHGACSHLQHVSVILTGGTEHANSR